MSNGGPRGSGGWVVLLAVGVFNAVQGAVLAALGGEAVQESVANLVGVPWSDLVSSTPAVAAYVNDLLMIVGLFLAAFGVLVAAVAATGYRRRRPWAWYSMWVVPVFYSITAVVLYAKGEVYFSDDLSSELFVFLLVLAFLVQAAEWRGFRRAEGPHPGRITPS